MTIQDTRPVHLGDVGMYISGKKRKICFIIKIHRGYFKILLPTIPDSKKIKRVLKRKIEFPPAYFENRSDHMKECQNFLTCVHQI